MSLGSVGHLVQHVRRCCCCCSCCHCQAVEFGVCRRLERDPALPHRLLQSSSRWQLSLLTLYGFSSRETSIASPAISRGHPTATAPRIGTVIVHLSFLLFFFAMARSMKEAIPASPRSCIYIHCLSKTEGHSAASFMSASLMKQPPSSVLALTRSSFVSSTLRRFYKKKN